MPAGPLTFDGHIMGASFASGDRIVVGRWFDSPFGPVADAMWRRADGTRVLIAGDRALADFVDRHYAFDHVLSEVVRAERSAQDRIEVSAGPLQLTLRVRAAGSASLLLRLRPRALRTRPTWIAFEDRVGRRLAGRLFAAGGVRTRGITRAGAREWYAIHDIHWADASASRDGRDLGSTVPGSPAGFGFSEFPSRPALVRVTSRFEANAD